MPRRRASHLGQDELLDLIRLIYAAALDEAAWPTFLNRLPDIFAGTGALLLHHDMATSGRVAWSSELDPDGLAQYQDYYNTIDPWATSEAARQRATAGSILPDEALLPRRELTRTEFYGFVRQQRMSRVMVTTILRDSRQFSGLSIYRAEEDPPFNDECDRFMRVLLPHLTQALKVHNRLLAASIYRTASAELLDALPTPVFFVDAHGTIRSMNRAARALRPGANGIGAERGHLTCGSPQARQALRAALAVAARTGRAVTSESLGHVAIQRAERRPLLARVLPIVSPAQVGVDDGVTACVFVFDPEKGAPGATDGMLRALFGLTPGEARVARRLAEGRSLEDIGADLGLTRETTRWYVKQLLAKVGVSSQAQLVSVLTRLPGFP